MANIYRQYLTFHGKTSREYSLYLTGPGVYDAPAPDVEEVTIPGMNGALLRDNAQSGMRRFQNVDIKYKGLCLQTLPSKTAAVKSWLLSPTGYCRLQDTFAPDFYRMAMCTSALSFTTTRNRYAEMELVFNCKPQRWSLEGEEAVTLSESGSIITNPYEFYAQPLIRVYGYGEGSVTIGDRSVSIYLFTNYVDLDCETQNAYNASGFCNETILSDDFPVLAPGDNEVVWDGEITSVEITPRWWTL